MIKKYFGLVGLVFISFTAAQGQRFLDQFEIPKGNPSKVVESFTVAKNGGIKEVVTSTFYYEDGHIKSTQIAYPEQEKNKSIEYTFSGKVPMEITEKDANGELIATYYVNADFSNNISGFKKMDKQYQTLKHEGYKYEDDRLVKYTIYDTDGKPESITTFEYNSYGLLIRKSTMRDGKENSYFEYTLNGKGQVATEIFVHHEYSYLSYEFKYTYNEHDDMLTTEMSTGNVNYFEYEYDEKGNWTTKKSWFKNSAETVHVYKRTITY